MCSGARGLLKKVGEGVSAWPGSSMARWPLARASGVWDRAKQREKEAVLRQRVKAREALTLAKFQMRESSAGLGRGCRLDARQVFDGCTSSRAQPIDNDRGSKISMAWPGRLCNEQGSLVTSYLGKMSTFRKRSCPWMSITNQRERRRHGW
jgi:hypothetical protein